MNESLLCNWESYLVSQLYWLKGPCNRFQTHKRFKRFEVYKSDALVLLFWKQNRWLSANQITFPPGGKTIQLVPRYWVSTHMIGQKWNSQLSLVPRTHKFEWILKDEGHDPDYVYKEVKSRIKTFITPKTFELWTSLYQSLGGYSFCSFNSILRVYHPLHVYILNKRMNNIAFPVFHFVLLYFHSQSMLSH